MKPCYNEARSRWRAEMGWAWTVWSLTLLAVVATVLSKLALAMRSYFSHQVSAKNILPVGKKEKVPPVKKPEGSRDGAQVRKTKGVTATKVSSEPRKKKKKKTSPKVGQQK